MSLKARERINGAWTLNYRDQTHCVHNHAAGNPSVFHEHRKMGPETIKHVNDMMAATIRPMQIAALLNDEEDAVPVSHRDLYNLKARTSRIQRHGLQASDALEANLERDQANDEIYFRYYLNPSGQLCMVYFAIRSAVQYAQRYHEIFILDCTYKTNKHDMPLLIAWVLIFVAWIARPRKLTIGPYSG